MEFDFNNHAAVGPYIEPNVDQRMVGLAKVLTKKAPDPQQLSGAETLSADQMGGQFTFVAQSDSSASDDAKQLGQDPEQGWDFNPNSHEPLF